MMKKYVFRLEPVLKLRRLNEENCRMELGQLMAHLTKIEDQLAHDRTEANRYFEIQELSLKGGVRGGQLQAFPMLMAAKEQNIKLLSREKQEQEYLIEQKRQQLAILRGELKVIENLKEKDYTEYRKSFNKEVDEKVEEQTQIWLGNNREKKA